jgi:hypothetical protein
MLTHAQLVTVAVPSPVILPSWQEATWRVGQVLHHGVSPYPKYGKETIGPSVSGWGNPPSEHE